MAQVKFYRGGQTASLPNTIEDGAIYILDNGDNSGELYTDIGNQRIKVGTGQSSIVIKTTQEWRAENPKTISKLGNIYIFSDARAYQEDYEENGETLTRTVTVPGIKIGDGQTYVVDLPFSTITTEQINFWNNKVNCYLETEYNEQGNQENLVFTRTF